MASGIVIAAMERISPERAADSVSEVNEANCVAGQHVRLRQWQTRRMQEECCRTCWK